MESAAHLKISVDLGLRPHLALNDIDEIMGDRDEQAVAEPP